MCAQSQIAGLLHGVVAVDGLEVAHVQPHLVVDVPGAAQSEAVAVAGERRILLVAVGEAVVGTLAAAADSELVVDVELHAGQQLVCAALQLFLAVAGHLRVLVVEKVVFHGGTQLRVELIAQGHCQQGRHVVARLGTVLIAGHLVAKLLERQLALNEGHDGGSGRVGVPDSSI